MCDTMAATGTATITGHTIFAKNSDRERNEAQFLDMQPRRRYGRGAVLRATYIAIPQAAETHAVLLSRPFWIWGAEMGVNEHGVAIGNEAVHPRLPPQRREALIGMDLLRLGLERGASAREAVHVITALLEAHGQGGSCGHLGRRYYDNSFIVADAGEAFVLETVGRHWAVKRIDGAGAISNTYAIGADIDACSGGLQTLRAGPGLVGWRRALRFRRCRHRTHRCAVDDGDSARPRADWHPQDVAGGTICMHAADRTRRGQSVGSLVSDLRGGDAVHWVTGTSAPCTGVFKPVFLDSGLPDSGPQPGDRHDPETLWWRHETLHRALLHSDSPWVEFAQERDTLERRFSARVEAALRGDTATRRAVTGQCWQEAEAAEARWLRAVTSRNAPASLRRSYVQSWAKHDQLACVPV